MKNKRYNNGSLFYSAKVGGLIQEEKVGEPEAEEIIFFWYPFEEEVDNALYYLKGAVATAREVISHMKNRDKWVGRYEYTNRYY